MKQSIESICHVQIVTQILLVIVVQPPEDTGCVAPSTVVTYPQGTGSRAGVCALHHSLSTSHLLHGLSSC